MLADNGLTTATISAHVQRLQEQLVLAIQDTPLGEAALLNQLYGGSHARFLAFRSPDAAHWCDQLAARGCITDVRGEVIRIGLALYHDEHDVDAFAALAKQLSSR
jgi:selenocysteine lyase/cysteine desulfurase